MAASAGWVGAADGSAMIGETHCSTLKVRYEYSPEWNCGVGGAVIENRAFASPESVRRLYGLCPRSYSSSADFECHARVHTAARTHSSVAERINLRNTLPLAHDLSDGARLDGHSVSISHRPSRESTADRSSRESRPKPQLGQPKSNKRTVPDP